jgi:hypothetical protein
LGWPVDMETEFPDRHWCRLPVMDVVAFSSFCTPTD